MPPHRNVLVPELHARQHFHFDIANCASLRCGKRAYLRLDKLDIANGLRIDSLDQSIHFCLRQTKALGRPSIESLRILADSVIAARFDIGDHAFDCCTDVLICRAGLLLTNAGLQMSNHFSTRPLDEAGGHRSQHLNGAPRHEILCAGAIGVHVRRREVSLPSLHARPLFHDHNRVITR